MEGVRYLQVVEEVGERLYLRVMHTVPTKYCGFLSYNVMRAWLNSDRKASGRMVNYILINFQK